jgi:hypothetical protein
MRLRILGSALVVVGCCTGHDATAGATPEPVASAVSPTPPLDPACLGLCERIATCDRDEGRMPSAPDCAAGCGATGVYGALDATALACADAPTCDAVRACAGPALAATLVGSIAAAAPTTAPESWPAGLPTLPGGAAREAPSMGPVRVALIGYGPRRVADVDHDYRDVLGAAGWTVTDAPADDGEAHRFVAARDGESVSVSIYAENGDTIIQTMQIGETR